MERSLTLEPIVLVGEFPADSQAQIDREFRCITPGQVLADPALRNTVRAIITRSNFSTPQALVDALPALRVIATSGVGYDRIPVAAAQQRGIAVSHTPGLLDAAVSELALGLLLALLRHIPQADAHVRTGAWQRGEYPLTTSLAGRRVGIVGLGRIGKGVAARLAGFDVAIHYAGRQQPGVPHRHHASALAMAAEVDVLIVCCPGGPQTHHLIDGAVLQALGAGYLVNVSRGSVVDEAALAAALLPGGLRGAALDVFEAEPLPDDSPLREMPHVLLSPHAGTATAETRAAMLRLTLDNLHAVLAGGAALTPVPSSIPSQENTA